MSKHHKLANCNYRQLWESVYGKIPNGYHIHHKDGNPYNNDISNLECLSPEEHSLIHQSEFIKWASVGGALGGEKCKNERLGIFSYNEEKRKENSKNALSHRKYDLDSQRRKEEYKNGSRKHWTTYYTDSEITEKISSGDPGKSMRGKEPWNKDKKMTLKNPDLARYNKSQKALSRPKYKCSCCDKSFDAGNLKRHQQAQIRNKS